MYLEIYFQSLAKYTSRKWIDKLTTSTATLYRSAPTVETTCLSKLDVHYAPRLKDCISG